MPSLKDLVGETPRSVSLVRLASVEICGHPSELKIENNTVSLYVGRTRVLGRFADHEDRVDEFKGDIGEAGSHSMNVDVKGHYAPEREDGPVYAKKITIMRRPYFFIGHFE